MHTVEVAAQTGAVVTLSAGQRLSIIDVEGGQVADLFAVSTDDHLQWLSTSATRTAARRLFPAVGEQFLSGDYQPLLTFERDDSPGVHDMLAAPCSPAMYAALGHVGPHASCTANFLSCAERVGCRRAVVPDPVNFFQNMPARADGTFTPLPAPSAAGDSVTLRAETEVHVIVAACAMALEAINGTRCTALQLRVH